MTKLVGIDDDLHKQIKNIVNHQKMSIDYPTIQFYVNQAIKDKLKIDIERLAKINNEYLDMKNLEYRDIKEEKIKENTETVEKE